MPKMFTYPLLLDKTKILSINMLKEYGYLMPYTIKSGVIEWIRAGKKAGRIRVYSNMSNEPFIKLKYITNNTPICYEIKLVSLPSNLGIGKIWYFKCPFTAQRCRKLYKSGNYFLHRDAIPNAMYKCQAHSKRVRMIDKVCRIMYGSDKLYEELYSKHFKTHYAGKPTKRYKQIIRDLEFYKKYQNHASSIFKQVLYS